MRKPARHHIERGEPIRLQTFLARSGLSSRRGAEEMIAHGRVGVNGETVTTPGVKIVPGTDRVDVDGEEVKVAPTTWVALHKPKGYVTSRIDPYGRPTVYDLLPEQFHGLFHVGRLDRDSEGLLLLTNDGALANRFLHPSFGVTKEYDVIATGKPSDAVLHALQDGVELEDGIARAESAKLLGPAGNGLSRLKLVLREGKKREVRRMLEAVGHPVRRLVRRRFGPVDLAELPEGKWRVVAPEELAAVRDATPEPRRASSSAPARRARGRGADEDFRLDPERPLASFGKPAGKAGSRARPSRGKGESRPPRGEDRPSRADKRPSRGDDRPARGEGRPARGEDRPSREEKRPGRPTRGDEGPSRGAKRPTRGEGRPTRGGRPDQDAGRPYGEEKRPARGEGRPTRGDERPSRGEKRPARDENRPTRGDDRPAQGSRPARGEDRPARGNRPDRGDDRPPRKPSGGGGPKRPGGGRGPGKGGGRKPGGSRGPRGR